MGGKGLGGVGGDFFGAVEAFWAAEAIEGGVFGGGGGHDLGLGAGEGRVWVVVSVEVVVWGSM